MKEKDFATSIQVDKSPTEVFNAINNVRGWGQGQIVGSSDKLSDEFTYQMSDIHFSKQKIVEMKPNLKVVWLVTESNLSFVKKKDEWTDTKVQFEISSVKGKTKLTFTHHGLVSTFECYGRCSGIIDWKKFI
jgi:hypothetical protein